MYQHYFISLYVGYSCFSVGLFEDHSLLDDIKLPKIKASSLVIPSVKLLLDRNDLSLDTLTFISACNGPGPFSGLRIAVVTANGLAYATGKSLIAINSFDALALDNINPISLMLYNAYGGDFYYRFIVHAVTHDGCSTLNQLSTLIISLVSNLVTISCSGQGALLALPILQTILFSYNFVINQSIEEPTLKALGTVAYQNYTKGLVQASIEPLYLKIGYNL